MTTHLPGRPAAKLLLDAEAIERTLSRIAHELIEHHADLASVALVGIHTRGAPLAARLRRLVAERSGIDLDLGALDITFHRDDVLVRNEGAPLHAQPVVHGTALDFPLEGRTVVLVDDVLYTGRTIRAAIDALFDYGRPACVQLAVLVDRVIASFRSDPTSWARTCRRPTPSGCRCGLSRSTRRRECS